MKFAITSLAVVAALAPVAAFAPPPGPPRVAPLPAAPPPLVAGIGALILIRRRKD
jgi:hypothetical protein